MFEKNKAWPTIGFELEGVFPGASREEAFTRVYDIIEQEIIPVLYMGREVDLENYDFKTRRGDPRQGTKLKVLKKSNRPEIIWQIKDDGSIVPPAEHIGVELVSPILRGRREIQSSYTWIRVLSKRGFKAEANSAAFQVHAGFTNDGPMKGTVTNKSTVSEVVLMLWVFSKIDKEMMREFGTTASRQKFTMPIPQTVIDLIESGKINVANTVLSEFIEKNFDYRYWSINPHALFQFGTFELRIANSTTNVSEIESLVDFMGLLTQAVRSKDTRLINLLKKYIDTDIPLNELAHTLGMKLERRLCNSLLGAG